MIVGMVCPLSGRSTSRSRSHRLVGGAGTASRTGGWIEWLIEPWATLGGEVVFVMLQIAVLTGSRGASAALVAAGAPIFGAQRSS